MIDCKPGYDSGGGFQMIWHGTRRPSSRGIPRRCSALLAVLVALPVAAQQGTPPHLGYVYPAGGPPNSEFQVIVGGQRLRGPTNVYVTGQGVSAMLVEYDRALDRNQAYNIYRNVRAIKEQRAAEAQGKEYTPPDDLPKLPTHPLLRDLERRPNRELDRLTAFLFNPKVQPNGQLADEVFLQVRIDADAKPGDHEIRLETAQGVSNPMLFEVGALPEYREEVPFVERDLTIPFDTPIVLNGQILPGDVDRYRFNAKQGQQLVIRADARKLVPYLADAVPGWFQAVLAVHDGAGNELAYGDDFRFNPDPVLMFQPPADGVYQVAIYDSIYRGRADFVYRLTISEEPFVTSLFPLGGQMGQPTTVQLRGWNLPTETFTLDTEHGNDELHDEVLRWPQGEVSNAVRYAVDHLPEALEAEPNDSGRQAQQVMLPRILNGRISRPGDLDVYRFSGRLGDEIVAEVNARRLYSPLDALLKLTDSQGRTIAWNDDAVPWEHDPELPDHGRLTHQADSYLRAKLPADGTYYVELSDAQEHGGDAYAYRLRLSPPEPDFVLRVNPSSLNVPVGRVIPLNVHAVRIDGFDGDIELVLKESQTGFRLSGGWVPRGQSDVRATLTAPAERVGQAVPLHLEGRATINGRLVVRHAVPVDDVMQAFLYRHLLAARDCLAAVTPTNVKDPAGDVAGKLPIQLPAGGQTTVRITTGKRPTLTDVAFELSDPPEGVKLGAATALDDGLELIVTNHDKPLPVGYANNLIVEVYWVGEGQKMYLGLCPAIPIEVVGRQAALPTAAADPG